MPAAAPLHDIGRLAIPEYVRAKPGRLTPDECGNVATHPLVGAVILERVRFPYPAAPIVRSHHQKWDGRGYPAGLVAEEIPMFGRLIGLADAFDAMSSTRTYRRSLKRSQVLEEIRNCAGSQFDPNLVDLFLALDFGPFYEMLRTHQACNEQAA